MVRMVQLNFGKSLLLWLQVSFADEIVELIQERDGLAAACAAAQDAAADMQQQNRYQQFHTDVCMQMHSADLLS